jgi:hypothetical protein
VTIGLERITQLALETDDFTPKSHVLRLLTRKLILKLDPLSVKPSNLALKTEDDSRESLLIDLSLGELSI